MLKIWRRKRLWFWAGCLVTQVGGFFHMMETVDNILVPLLILCAGCYITGSMTGIGLGAAWEEERVTKWQRERNSAPF